MVLCCNSSISCYFESMLYKSNQIVFCLQICRKGSFLNRSKAALAQISARSKVALNPAGPTNSKNFIFQVMTPDEAHGKSEVIVFS